MKQSESISISTPRDPKLNPKVGDVLRKGKQTRTVTGLHFRIDGVAWRADTRVTKGQSSWLGTPTITDWRRWARNAEVICAAD